MHPSPEIPPGFELISCPMCASDQWTVARQGKDWYLDPNRTVQVARCDKCGLHYTNPRPTPAHVGAYYPTDYPPHLMETTEAEEKGALRELILRNAYGAPSVRPTGFARLFASITSHFKSPEKCGSGLPYHGRGRLLDFGCGNGKFLRRMASLGWDVTGLDMGDQAVQSVRASGLKALQGTLPHPDLAPKSFDVVTMRQSLEHVHDPVSVLKAAHDLLDDNGLLLVNVPNYASWEIDYFGDASLSLQLPRHLTHFTPDTLRAMLQRTGFDVQSIRQVCRSSWIKRSLTRTERRGPRPLDPWLKLSPFRNAVAKLMEIKGRGNDLTAIARRI